MPLPDANMQWNGIFLAILSTNVHYQTSKLKKHADQIELLLMKRNEFKKSKINLTKKFKNSQNSKF